MKVTIGLAAALCLAAGTAQADYHETNPLVGVWDWPDGAWTITYAPEGYAAPTANNITMAILEYSVQGDTVIVRAVSPPPNAPDRTCGLENEGTYSFTVDGDTATSTLVEGPCAGRAEAFGGATFSRRAMPTLPEEE